MRYPLLCIVRGHRWKPRAFWPGYVRTRSCRRCEHIGPTTTPPPNLSTTEGES